MSYLLLLLVLVLPGAESYSLFCASGPSKSAKSAVITFNTSGLPVRLNTATIEDSNTDSWLDYSITNDSAEEIREIYLRVFVFNSTGELVSVKESFKSTTIAPAATLRGRARIEEELGKQDLIVVAVSEIVGTSGVWQVDTAGLEAAIRRRVERGPEPTVKVSFEPNLIITQGDKARIFELALLDILNDKEKSKRLSGMPQLIVMSDSVDFPLPRLPEKELVALTYPDIQAAADRVERIVYLRYEPLNVKGSRVVARIALRDAVTRKRQIWTQYKYTFVLTFVKDNGQWTLQKSTGYAQS